MSDVPDEVLFQQVSDGDPRAFETLYHRYNVRLRLAAWRMTRRGDWLDDLANETWRRAFEGRASFDPMRPFLVWLVGILRNVVREHLRQRSEEPLSGAPTEKVDPLDPYRLAAEAEMLEALEECVGALSAEDRDVVRWRFFEGVSLREVAVRLRVPEATLRTVRLPAICERLRLCLKHKGVAISQVFPAQEGDVLQYLLGERE
jgi:RNA polymerase sigma-70 factor (ECF subfamily)